MLVALTLEALLEGPSTRRGDLPLGRVAERVEPPLYVLHACGAVAAAVSASSRGSDVASAATPPPPVRALSPPVTAADWQ